MPSLTSSLFFNAFNKATWKIIPRFNINPFSIHLHFIPKRFNSNETKLKKEDDSNLTNKKKDQYAYLFANDYAFQKAVSTTKLPIYKIDDKFNLVKIDHVMVNSYVFGAKPRPDILHNVFTWERASQRSGNVCVRNRSEMQFSKKKLRPQKGSGRARMADRAAPHLHGGGKAHAPKPKDYNFFLPKRIVRSSLRMALSQRLSEGNLFIFDDLSSQTKEIIEYIKKRSDKKICIVDVDIPVDLTTPIKGLENTDILSIYKLKLSNILKNYTIFMSLDAAVIYQRFLSFDGLKVESTKEYFMEEDFYNKMENLFSSTIRTTPKPVPRYILFKGTRIEVLSKRYDLKRKLTPYAKRGKGLGARG